MVESDQGGKKSRSRSFFHFSQKMKSIYSKKISVRNLRGKNFFIISNRLFGFLKITAANSENQLL